MKNYIIFFLFAIFVFYACKPKDEHKKNQFIKVMKAEEDKTIEQQLIGEWAVVSSWEDTVLTFKNTLVKSYKQEVFPSYNTIVFNAKTNIVDVQTYGEFGCGMAAVQNLSMERVKWSVTDGKLHLKGVYSNYSGVNKIDNFYKINRVGEVLTLTKMKISD
ncbi:MAG: hypothetical protein EOP00_00120 [Pedobacter sp.]|nr:MAG: hypothetical protein EOP00_00120 [Pedobacter sp.]